MSVWQRIGQWLKKLWEGIFQGLLWLWDLLKPAFEGVFRAISSLGSSVLMWIYGFFIILLEFVSDLLGDLFTGIFEAFQVLVPTESISLAGVFSPNQQALAWALYDYCAIDFLLGRIGAFGIIVAAGGVIRFSVWTGRKLISIVRGAGV